MSEKRRDNRNRILRSGESQRKDGRYAYKYTDTFGKVQFVYAWKLVPTDKTPAGKRDDISLREKEKEIQKGETDTEPDLHSQAGLDVSKTALLLFPSLKLGNNTFDLSRFARRCKQRQPQNMAHITSDLSVRK